MGFAEERAVMAKQNASLAPAYLFFGCRHPDHDFLYREQLENWDKEGVIYLRPVFSRYQEPEVRMCNTSYGNVARKFMNNLRMAQNCISVVKEGGWLSKLNRLLEGYGKRAVNVGMRRWRDG